jgi:hypothetical protein
VLATLRAPGSLLPVLAALRAGERSRRGFDAAIISKHAAAFPGATAGTEGRFSKRNATGIGLACGAVAVEIDVRRSPEHTMYKGSCLCRNVQYEIAGEIGEFGYCHCTSCRKASGTAHAANAPVRRIDFHLVSGADYLREFESSPGKVRVFCSRCGSPLYAYLRADLDIIRIRLGTLDTPFEREPMAHTWVSDKASWGPIDDNLPQFPEWAPRSVLVQKGSRQP